MIKHKIKNLIDNLLSENLHEEDNASDLKFSISQPPAGIKGDYAVNLPMVYARKKGLPLDDAVEKFLPLFEKLEVISDFRRSGGFINFNIKDDFLNECLIEILGSEGFEIYHLKENSARRALVEFVSSNPTGPLHIGHARSAVIGDSLARIYEALGYKEVKREYYVNDLGLQVRMLGNSVLARIREIKGLPFEFPRDGYKGAYIYDIAREAIEKFGDAVESADIAGFAVSKMLETTRRDLEAFGVKMDNYFSEASLKDETEILMKEFLLEKKLAYVKDGALWFGSSSLTPDENSDDKDRVLKKRTGEYTYFATDITYHRNKFERGFDEIINVWGADHHGYVPRIKAAVGAMGYDVSKLKIILYQLVSLRRGAERIAMSTRAGEFVTLKEVLDEVGRDAARFFLLMRAPDSSVDFDLELAKKQSADNPVYYVQYAHARICSVFDEAMRRIPPHEQNGQFPSEDFIMSDGKTDFLNDEVLKKDLSGLLTLLKEPPERELMKAISSFGDILLLSKNDLSAHHITTYLVDVARKLHNFYEKCRVISQDNRRLSYARLALLKAVRKIIRSGLDVIGVSAPQKM